MPKANYSNYSFNDFLEDDHFVQWVLSPTPQHEDFWRTFLLSHPEKEDVIKQASVFITTFSNQQTFSNHAGKEQLWQRISLTVKPQEARTGSVRPLYVPLYMKIAAAI